MNQQLSNFSLFVFIVHQESQPSSKQGGQDADTKHRLLQKDEKMDLEILYLKEKVRNLQLRNEELEINKQ